MDFNFYLSAQIDSPQLGVWCCVRLIDSVDGFRQLRYEQGSLWPRNCWESPPYSGSPRRSSADLPEGATRTEHDTIVAVEAYLYENLTNPVQSSRPFFLAMQGPLSISQIIGASNRVPFLVSNCNYPYRPGFLIFRM